MFDNIFYFIFSFILNIFYVFYSLSFLYQLYMYVLVYIYYVYKLYICIGERSTVLVPPPSLLLHVSIIKNVSENGLFFKSEPPLPPTLHLFWSKPLLLTELYPPLVYIHIYNCMSARAGDHYSNNVLLTHK